jgi:hypothetical protein
MDFRSGALLAISMRYLNAPSANNACPRISFNSLAGSVPHSGKLSAAESHLLIFACSICRHFD